MKRFLAPLLLAIFVAPATFSEVVEAVLARVGDRIVTRSVYLRRLEMGLGEIAESSAPDQVASRQQAYRENLLGEMIDELLIKDRADRVGLTVSDQEVAEAIERLKEQYGIKTDEGFERSLAESGLTRMQLENRLRDTILTNKLFAKELRPAAQMSDRELRQHYEREKERFRLPERARVREIVLMKPDGAAQAAIDEIRQRAADIALRVRQGEDFAMVASQSSDAPSKSQGGSLGAIAKGELIREIDQAVFSSDAGVVVGPIETLYGFHVLLVEERLPEILPSFESIKDQLKKESSEETFQRDLRAYLEGLRKDAFVVVFEDRVPGLAASN